MLPLKHLGLNNSLYSFLQTMTKNSVLSLHTRKQRLVKDAEGYTLWQSREEVKTIPAKNTAIIICDVWDHHWCRGAGERLEKLLPRMNMVIQTARSQGMLIIHAPSETMTFYKDTPARKRALDAPEVQAPQEVQHDDPPLPIDDSDGGCDTDENFGDVDEALWTRQHELIEINQEQDVISDDGQEIYNVLQQNAIHHMIILGVHTNICMLNRSFGIKQMVRWGVDILLCRDLTDSLYNPTKPPYVSHKEGTRLVVEFIEKFWCPSILSDDLIPFDSES